MSDPTQSQNEVTTTQESSFFSLRAFHSLPSGEEPASWQFAFVLWLVATGYIVFYSVVSIYADRDWVPRVLIASAAVLSVIPGIILRLHGLWTRRKHFPVATPFGIFEKGKARLGLSKLPWEGIMAGMILLGCLNAAFALDPGASLNGMALFLLTSVFPFLSAFYLFDDQRRMRPLMLTLSGFLVAMLVLGGIQYLFNQEEFFSIRLMSLNPIPAGTVLLLLLAGPLFLVRQSEGTWKKFVYWGLIILTVVLVFLVKKKTPIMGLLVMAVALGAVWGRLTWKRILTFGLAFILLVSLMPGSIKDRILAHDNIMIRLEFYSLGWQAFKANPITGTGFNSPKPEALIAQYEPRFYYPENPEWFRSLLRDKMRVGLDNILLSLFVEAGGVFTVLFGWVWLRILPQMWKLFRRENAKEWAALWIPLAGAWAASMAFDSLKYPDLNWLMHTLLGAMAGRAYLKTKEVKD